MQHEYSTDDVAETERTLCSLFFKLVVSHQRRDEESCRKPKSEVSENARPLETQTKATAENTQNCASHSWQRGTRPTT